MSLHTNSDYDVISDAEISSAISKYSLNMIDMSLNGILRFKGSNSSVAQFGMGNLVASYENNFKIDMQKYPQAADEMSEMRVECYNKIMDRICEVHSLSYQLPSDADIYTSAYHMYSFLVSDFYSFCISFFVNYIVREANAIYKLYENKYDSIHQYAKKRYSGNSSLGFIHTNLDKVLDDMRAFDITIYDIINTAYQDKSAAIFLCSILIDNGDFFKNFYYPTVSGYRRPNAVTDIRLALMPISPQIINYIEEEN